MSKHDKNKIFSSLLSAAEPVVIENGEFSWDSYDSFPILRDINMKVKAGSLVAVVGTVGSGKSSLLSAILGEMYKQSGRVNTIVRYTDWLFSILNQYVMQ